LGAGLLACASLTLSSATSVSAHGFAGARFFPATLATDDPFVADEWSFPTIAWSRDADQVATTSYALDFAKRITRDFAVGFSGSYLQLRQPAGPALDGFDNLSVSGKYQLIIDASSETILAFGVDADIGGTGAKRVGADQFSAVAPAFFFGKGMGDLPPSMSLLRPLAVTGSIGVGIPAGARPADLAPDSLQLGLAIEYSLTYLQSQVRDVGLGAPWNRTIPLVEIALQKPLDAVRQKITGTINPGLLWAGQYVQLGAEAQIPLNRDSGRGVGFIVQLHLYIDDLFPQTLGRTIFGA
jgi:hypothetical protein